MDVRLTDSPDICFHAFADASMCSQVRHTHRCVAADVVRPVIESQFESRNSNRPFAADGFYHRGADLVSFRWGCAKGRFLVQSNNDSYRRDHNPLGKPSVRWPTQEIGRRNRAPGIFSQFRARASETMSPVTIAIETCPGVAVIITNPQQT